MCFGDVSMTPKIDAKAITEILARALIEAKEQELADLDHKARRRLARGTRELVPSLEARVVTLLTNEAQDTRAVAEALNVPVGRVRQIVEKLRDATKIHNIGSEVEPLWQHVLGDDCSAADLRELVLRLIRSRPFTHRELVIVTGARDNRVSGVLADLREDASVRVTNLGNGSKGRWFALPAEVKLAPLGRAAGSRG